MTDRVHAAAGGRRNRAEAPDSTTVQGAAGCRPFRFRTVDTCRIMVL
ncbi:hypothetical protein GCM10009834_18900 [Streptomonospora arabica]